jgi:hypothetical protein
MTARFPHKRPNCEGILKSMNSWALIKEELKINDELKNIIASKIRENELSIYSILRPKVIEIKIESKDSFVRKNEIYYNKRFEEIAYQLKLLMLFLKRGLDNNYSFKLATEMDAAEKFDDVVFIYEENAVKFGRFLQAKHIRSQKQRIRINDLLIETDERFSLQKYFISFREIKKHNLFKNIILKDFIICTNIGFDFKQIESNLMKLEKKESNDHLYFEELSENDTILNAGGKRYKFVGDNNREKRNSSMALLEPNFKNTSDLIRLAKLLAESLFGKRNKNRKSPKISLNEKLFRKYQIALCEKVIDFPNKKFKEDFLKDSDRLSHETKNFRRIFIEEVKNCKELKENPKKDQKQCSQLNADIDVNYTKAKVLKTTESSTPKEESLFKELKETKLEISENFGKYFRMEVEPLLFDIENFSKEFSAEIKRNESNKLVEITRHKDIFKKNIDKIAGHVLVSKRGKIGFNNNFFEMNQILPGNLMHFRNHFLMELKTVSIDPKALELYSFEIANYKTCLEEEYLNLKFTLPDDSITDEEIYEFMNKTVFAVNQPNEEELGRILNSEIGAKFSLLNSEYLTNDIEVKMWNWMKDKEGKYLSLKDAQLFFSELEEIISSSILFGPTSEYCTRMKNMDIKFNHSNTMNFKIGKFLKSNRKFILNIFARTDTLFSAIKVYQTLQNVENSDFMRKDGSIFVNSKKLSNLKSDIIEALKVKNKNKLLVIECCEVSLNESSLISNFINELLNIGIQNSKKIILLTKKEHRIEIHMDSDGKCSYCEIDDMDNNFDSLDHESKKKVLHNNVVIFQGRETPLASFLSTDDQFSGNLIDEKVLSLLIRKKKLIIGHKLDEMCEYYIEPNFRRQNILSGQFSESKDSSLHYAFSGVELKWLKEKFPGEQIINSGDLLSGGLMLSKVILLEENEAGPHFEQVCQKWKTNTFYWLKKVKRNIILQRAYGHLFGIRQFLEKNYANEYQCKRISDFDEKILIISAEPGMGKSTLLTYMALQEKIKNPLVWIIRIDLVNTVKKLDKINNFGEDELISFISQHEGSHDLETNILKHKIYFQGEMILLFDGFDEISPRYTQKVLKLLNELKNTKIEKIWVTTRPHLKYDLENEFTTLSYEICAFNKDNQKEFLKNFWTKNLELPLIGDKRFNIFSTQILQLITRSIQDKERKFIGIPLQTRILAEAYKNDFENFHQSYCEEPNLPKNLNLLELYRTFINKKYEIYFKKLMIEVGNPGVEDLKKASRKLFDIQHKFFAIKALFGNAKLSPEKNFIDKESLSRIGIVKIIDKKIIFIHRTFAEYFAIEWLTENLSKNGVKKIIENRIFDVGGVMRNFFDHKLAGRNKMIIAILNDDEVTLKSLIEKNCGKNVRDEQGRTALHLAASYGFEKIVDFLVTKKAKINVIDNLFSWTPLQYAANGHEWGTVNLLLEKGANYSDIKNIDFLEFRYQEKTALHIACYSNYPKLVKTIFKIYNSKTQTRKNDELEKIIFAQDKFGQICLHSAAQG